MSNYKLEVKETLFGERFVSASPKDFLNTCFADKYEEIGDTVAEVSGIILAPIGSGKTHLAASLLENEKYSGYKKFEYVKATDLIYSAETIDYKGENYKRYLFENFMSQFLVIDDLEPKAARSPLFDAIMCQLIRQRSVCGKGTLILCPCDMKEFSSKFGKGFWFSNLYKIWEFKDAPNRRIQGL